MSRRMSKALVLLMGGFICAVLMGGTGQAQLLDRKAISLAEAKKMVTAAMAEAVKNKWQMAIVVADEHGTPIVLGDARTSPTARLRPPCSPLSSP